MEFEKKLRTRKWLAVGYFVLGVLMIVGSFVSRTENSFISAFGTALLVCGIARLRNYKRIARDEESIRRQEVLEKDERNIMLAEKARSWAFGLYVGLAGAAVILLSLLGMHPVAKWVAYSVCLLVVLYWGCWYVLRRKY